MLSSNDYPVVILSNKMVHRYRHEDRRYQCIFSCYEPKKVISVYHFECLIFSWTVGITLRFPLFLKSASSNTPRTNFHDSIQTCTPRSHIRSTNTAYRGKTSGGEYTRRLTHRALRWVDMTVIAAVREWWSLLSWQTDESLVSTTCEFSYGTPGQSLLHTSGHRLCRHVDWTELSMLRWCLYDVVVSASHEQFADFRSSSILHSSGHMPSAQRGSRRLPAVMSIPVDLRLSFRLSL